MNTVVRNEPENAVDIIAGATNFLQIEHIWFFQKKEPYVSTELKSARHAQRITCSISKRMLDPYRESYGEGFLGSTGQVSGAYGLSFEMRFSILINMVSLIPAILSEGLVVRLYEHLIDEWSNQPVQIKDGIRCLHSLENATSLPRSDVLKWKRAFETALLKATHDDCSAENLRELLNFFRSSGKFSTHVESELESVLRTYLKSGFRYDLHHCQSSEQCDKLIDDLNHFSSSLSVDVDDELKQVEEARAEFEENENAYADHMQDEWKDRYRGDRHTDDDIDNLFKSLNGDRD
jgi:hypothetical protein